MKVCFSALCTGCSPPTPVVIDIELGVHGGDDDRHLVLREADLTLQYHVVLCIARRRRKESGTGLAMKMCGRRCG